MLSSSLAAYAERWTYACGPIYQLSICKSFLIGRTAAADVEQPQRPLFDSYIFRRRCSISSRAASNTPGEEHTACKYSSIRTACSSGPLEGRAEG